MCRRSLVFVLATVLFCLPVRSFADDAAAIETTTPIKHLIVVIAENRSFDHLFGVYQPTAGQSIFNLLSEGIVTEDGSPGPNYAVSEQFSARSDGSYYAAPTDKHRYELLPPLMTGAAPQSASDTKGPPFVSSKVVRSQETGLDSGDQALLLTGGTGLPQKTIDTRLTNVDDLHNGVYPITPSIAYNAYMGGPTHRFFQMWQQLDCRADLATNDNPSGCLRDLFPWVETSVGQGSDGRPRPEIFDEQSTGEGSASMGFYNMSRNDAPYLKSLADEFTLSDNYHQAVNGGTGANHIMLGSGDMIWYANKSGLAAVPSINQIENPDPQPGTNNYYIQDGYAGGSYVNCADKQSPGVKPILSYLDKLNPKIPSGCEQGHFYLVNNYNPGYLANGRLEVKDPFTVPPSNLRTIGDALLAKNISFRYYGEGWEAYRKDPHNPLYCNICNFFQYTSSIMRDPARRSEHIADLNRFYSDVQAGALPAVSYIKPSSLNDGHPESSRLDILEAFTRRIVTTVKDRPSLWQDTAILLIFDEGGGYWDSGYIQPLDFFGDGTRIPILAISPYAEGGRVVHSYTDHVSILKFIEKNWGLPPLTARSRDNLPNPEPNAENVYVPANIPAIGDLMDMFHFDH